MVIRIGDTETGLIDFGLSKDGERMLVTFERRGRKYNMQWHLTSIDDMEVVYRMLNWLNLMLHPYIERYLEKKWKEYPFTIWEPTQVEPDDMEAWYKNLAEMDSFFAEGFDLFDDDDEDAEPSES